MILCVVCKSKQLNDEARYVCNAQRPEGVGYYLSYLDREGKTDNCKYFVRRNYTIEELIDDGIAAMSGWEYYAWKDLEDPKSGHWDDYEKISISHYAPKWSSMEQVYRTFCISYDANYDAYQDFLSME